MGMNLISSLHDTVEKAVLARLLMCGEVTKPLPPAVRADLMLYDPFYTDLFFTNTGKEVVDAQPTIPMHI